MPSRISAVVPFETDLILKEDRRRTRLVISGCRTCGAPSPVVVSRTPYVVYVRCSPCGSVWSIAKPGELSV
jgi:uncharacterized Zn finger protein